ncbi:UNVERIFIED_CONTAM: hypothetical protein FKN15_021024 [Acipenser sinensis]
MDVCQKRKQKQEYNRKWISEKRKKQQIVADACGLSEESSSENEISEDVTGFQDCNHYANHDQVKHYDNDQYDDMNCDYCGDNAWDLIDREVPFVCESESDITRGASYGGSTSMHTPDTPRGASYGGDRQGHGSLGEGDVPNTTTSLCIQVLEKLENLEIAVNE